MKSDLEHYTNYRCKFLCISVYNNVSLLTGGGQWGEPNSKGVVAVSEYDRQMAVQIKVNNHAICCASLYFAVVSVSSILLNFQAKCVFDQPL